MSIESKNSAQNQMSGDNSESNNIADQEIETEVQEVNIKQDSSQESNIAPADKDEIEGELEKLDEKLIEGQAEEKQLVMKKASTEDDEEEVDTSDAVPRFIGFFVIILVFGFLMGWSYMAPLDSAAYAPGFVTVESYRKTIQHLEGGIVKEIKTKDGQLVNKGDLLIVLDDTQLKAQLDIYETQYISALALSDRLEAERDNLTEIDFDEYLKNGMQNVDVKEVVRV